MNKNKALARIKSGKEKSGSTSDRSQVVDITTKTSIPNINDKIPAHVWATLQASAEQAATRLLELLSSNKFNQLRGAEQANLIRLAFEYAYGKPDAPLKRSVSVSLSGRASDQVSATLERLAGKVDLPEHSSDKPQNPKNGQVDQK